ncbi:hypothetical protein ABPG77_008862 [Micractinium sp. CCAP 211/92]
MHLFLVVCPTLPIEWHSLEHAQVRVRAGRPTAGHFGSSMGSALFLLCHVSTPGPSHLLLGSSVQLVFCHITLPLCSCAATACSMSGVCRVTPPKLQSWSCSCRPAPAAGDPSASSSTTAKGPAATAVAAAGGSAAAGCRLLPPLSCDAGEVAADGAAGAAIGAAAPKPATPAWLTH